MKYPVGTIVKTTQDLSNDIHTDLIAGITGTVVAIFEETSNEISVYISWDHPNIDCDRYDYKINSLDIIGSQPIPSFKVGDTIELVSETLFGFSYLDHFALSDIMDDTTYVNVDEGNKGVIQYISPTINIEDENGLSHKIVIKWDSDDEEFSWINPYMIRVINSVANTNTNTNKTSTQKVDIMSITRGLISGRT